MTNTTVRWTFRGMIAATVVLGTIAGAQALPVYDQLVTGADLVGERTNGAGGLVIAGGNASSASISWNIVFNAGTSLWRYSYSFAETSKQSISHFILDLSDNCGANSGCIMNFTHSSKTMALVYDTYTTNGNPGFTGSITGVKFDNLNSANPYTFAFDSERAPVWGDFYAKGGNGTSNGFAIFNAGASDHDSALTIDFIARPDTITGPGPGGAGDPVPAPASLLLLGAGLVGLAAARKHSA